MSLKHFVGACTLVACIFTLALYPLVVLNWIEFSSEAPSFNPSRACFLEYSLLKLYSCKQVKLALFLFQEESS